MPKNYQMVSPAAKAQMAGLLKHYRGKPHPFSTCVRENRKRFGPNTEKVCAVVKDLIEGGTHWREGSKKG
jgi:hypothetical protein